MQGDCKRVISEHGVVFGVDLLFPVHVFQSFIVCHVHSVGNIEEHSKSAVAEGTRRACNHAFSSLLVRRSNASLARILTIHCLFRFCSLFLMSSFFFHFVIKGCTASAYVVRWLAFNHLRRIISMK